VALSFEPTNDPCNRSKPSDRSLLRRIESGEQDAATALYLRYAKRLSLLARAQAGSELAARLDPEDVVQSVFRTFFRRAADGHYDIPDGEELWKLFLVIALNKIRALGQHHRAAKRNVGRTEELDQLQAFVPDDASKDESAFRVLRLTINELLDELPEVEATIVMLRIDGNNVQQIAETTKRSKRTVERVLQGFRQRLSAVLNEE
jgi:RNA polymerase sigma-70 factor (ECF subfamily)